MRDLDLSSRTPPPRWYRGTVAVWLLMISVLALSGCGDSGSPLLISSPGDSAASGGNGPRVNTLRVVDPSPDAAFQAAAGSPVEHVTATGFDDQGNVVFGPDHEDYDHEMVFPGFPESTDSVQLDFNRGQGYPLAQHIESVDFASDADGVVTLDQVAPKAVGANRATFTVRVVNNSDYPDDQVFVTVLGKNKQENAFYYIGFNPNDNNVSTPFGPVSNNAAYSQQLSLLKKEGEHAYSFQCPYENLVSGRVYLSFGKKLQGIGLNNTSDPLSLQLPSATGAPDYQTLYEFMELSATLPKDAAAPQIYTLFANTSVVDFFSIGLGMTLDYHNGGQNKSQEVGFLEGARGSILAEFEKSGTPAEFREYVRGGKDGQTILRVLSPVQVIALQPGGALSRFLDSAIDAGWAHYAAVVLNIPDNLPTHSFGYTYTGQLITNGILRMTCTSKPGGDTAGGDLQSLGEVCSLPKPSSRIVFFCDDNQGPPGPVRDTYRNDGSDGHKRLVSLLGAALNRGVFETYADWGDSTKFYTRADGKYNHYAKIMHLFALNGKVYGFGYDDVYGQDPTLARTLSDVNQIVLNIPRFARI